MLIIFGIITTNFHFIFPRTTWWKIQWEGILNWRWKLVKKIQRKISSFSFSFSARLTFVLALVFFFLLCPSFLLFENMSKVFQLMLFIYKCKIKVCIYAFWRKICLSLQRLSSKAQCINKQQALSKYHVSQKWCKSFKEARCIYIMLL